MIMRGMPATQWFGGPVPEVPTGAAAKIRPQWRGLGQSCMTLDEVRAALGGIYNCSPMDSACAMRNNQVAAAALNAIVSSSGNCIPPGTPLSFTPDMSEGALAAFMNNTAVSPPVYVGSRTVAIPGPGEPQPVQQPVPLPPAPPQSTVVNPSPGSQSTSATTTAASAGSAQSQSNGTTTTTNGSDLVSTVQGYVSDVAEETGLPDWAVWGGAAAALLWLLGRMGGRR